MDRARHRGLERADGAERARELRLRARRVELRAGAGVEPRLREIERRLLVHHVAARDVELLLETTQLEIGARDLGRDGDEHVAPRGLDRTEIRVARLEPTPHA